jgi:16S rRNA (uracil1498-N3)-methyltransferase
VSRPVFLIGVVDELDARPDGRYELTGPEGRHAATVQRLRPGEVLELVDGRGGRVRGQVVEVGRDRLTVVLGAIDREPAPAPGITVVQALPKGDRGELAVQLLTEVGVDVVVPWQAARCVVRWQGPRGEKALERWRATAREAAKQSRRAWVPVVEPVAGTAAVASRCATGSAGGAMAYVLHESATVPLSGCPLPAPGTPGELVLVIGPEGGVSEEELAEFTAAGATAVRLGPAVLRTSTAGVAAIALLSGRLGRW